MMLPVWVLLVGSAVVLQFVAGPGLAFAGFVMEAARYRNRASEAAWPLSRKLVTTGGLLLALATIEAIGTFAGILWWASNERFA